MVDDYHPVTSLQERKKMEATAQSLARAFGDGAERGRMKSDLTLQEAMGKANSLLADAPGRVYRGLSGHPVEGHAAGCRPPVWQFGHVDGGQEPWVREDLAGCAVLPRHGHPVPRHTYRSGVRHRGAGHIDHQEDQRLLHPER